MALEIVHIDLPIFHSPASAFGYFSGEVEVARMPTVDQAFPWPIDWLSDHTVLFEAQSKQVWSINSWEWPPAKWHVTMFGIFCASRDEATRLVAHIESISGLSFWAHESAGEPDT